MESVRSRVEYYDISPEVSEETAVFPGDAPYRPRVVLGFEAGDHLHLSTLNTTPHIGAHADAPLHYHPGGAGIGDRSLDYYLGPCQVVTVRLPRGERIVPRHLDGVEITEPRVLFHTASFPDPNRWTADFNSLSPELIERLAAQGVVLAGIDTPSVDHAESKALEAHQAVRRADMAILEGLVLDCVPDGRYRLVALPLRLKGAEASPVRAVLLRE